MAPKGSPVSPTPGEGDSAISTFAKMIERMEDLVLAGVSIPFTPWSLVNGDRLVPMLDRIRENLPDEIRHSQMIIDRRDDILVEAQRKGTQMLEDAKRQAEYILSESELMRAVREEAERIRREMMTELEAYRRNAYEEAEAVRSRAYEEARSVRDGADHYAETILSSLDKSLTESHTVVRNGQKHLHQTRQVAAQQLAAAMANRQPAPQMPSQLAEAAHDQPAVAVAPQQRQRQLPPVVGEAYAQEPSTQPAQAMPNLTNVVPPLGHAPRQPVVEPQQQAYYPAASGAMPQYGEPLPTYGREPGQP